MSSKLTIWSQYVLKSGHKIPVLGYGVFQTPPSETSAGVQHAIKAGYRHVDSAAYYRNEAASAQGLLKSGVPRDQLFFTSKIPMDGMSYDACKSQIKKTLKEVGDLGYVDLMLLHSPYGGTQGRLGAWKALAEAVEEGKIRSIGVSNFGVHHLEELKKYIDSTDAKSGKGKGGVLSVNQIELHPWLPHRDIIEWCKENGVLVQAWAPLVQGERWGDKVLRGISERTGKSEAQVLLRWSLQKGFNPLPKSVTPKRILENADLFDFEISEKDMASLETDEYDYHGWDPTTSPL